MENLEFKSIDNFYVAIANTTSYNSTRDVNVTDVLSNVAEDHRCPQPVDIPLVITSMRTEVIFISLLIWITCIVSLTLNCVRKNAKKAIFSGIGLIVPILSNIVAFMGQEIYIYYEKVFGLILVILALVIEIVIEIITFRFCFRKNK